MSMQSQLQCEEVLESMNHQMSLIWFMVPSAFKQNRRNLTAILASCFYGATFWLDKISCNNKLFTQPTITSLFIGHNLPRAQQQNLEFLVQNPSCKGSANNKKVPKTANEDGRPSKEKKKKNSSCFHSLYSEEVASTALERSPTQPIPRAGHS
ncbi:hypothetical protein BDR05DRAFT_953411 [Suillus weaverae]|nr:hypothetical protein BDR05DRAFT_953411 [Suillus weaverae]